MGGASERIFGVAGAGLRNASWAVNAHVAAVGRKGEERTSALLNAFAAPSDGVTVMHDLRIPIPNFTANIDHLVVSGSKIHIIDAKVWKPGRYWTLGGRTRRGWKSFDPADKQTMSMAYDAIGRYLNGRGVRHSLAQPVVAVWPSSERTPMRLGWLRIPGARAMTGAQFERYAAKTFAPSRVLGIGGGQGKPADPAIVAALAELLSVPTSRRRPTGTDAGW